MDSRHHVYDLARLHQGPRATLCPPPPTFRSSFYVRGAFSPCGGYVVAGSKERCAHIWNVSAPCTGRAAQPAAQPAALRGACMPASRSTRRHG